VIAGTISMVYFFNRNGEILWSYETSNQVKSVAISSNGSYVITGCENGEIYFFNHNGKLLWTYKAGDIVDSVAISSDGKYAVAGSCDRRVYFSFIGSRVYIAMSFNKDLLY